MPGDGVARSPQVPSLLSCLIPVAMAAPRQSWAEGGLPPDSAYEDRDVMIGVPA